MSTEGTKDAEEQLVDEVKVKELIENAASKDFTVQLDAVREMRKMLDNEDIYTCHMDQLISLGVIPPLLECLTRDDNPSLQLEAAKAVAKMVSRDQDCVKAVVTAGAIKPLVQLLQSHHQNLCEQVVKAIWNIVGAYVEFRDQVIEAGAVKHLLSAINQNQSVPFVKKFTDTIAQICCSRGSPVSMETIQEILPALPSLLHHQDKGIVENALQILSYISEDGGDRIQMVIDAELVPLIISLLEHSNIYVQDLAIRTVGNLATGSDDQTQVVLDCGALSFFPALLKCEGESTKKEALWVLSNITAGNQSQKKAVRESGLLPTVISLLDSDRSVNIVQREATWVISNLIQGAAKEEILFLIDNGVIPRYCNCLRTLDNQVLQIVLGSLKDLLGMAKETTDMNIKMMIKENGGLEKVTELKRHHLVNIKNPAVELLKLLDNGDDDDEDYGDDDDEDYEDDGDNA